MSNCCGNYDCNGDFYRNFSDCSKNIKDLRQFQEMVVYFEVEKRNSNLQTTKFSKEVPKSIRDGLLDVVNCMDSGLFEENDKFKIVYMRLHLDNLEKDGYRESLAKKIKKDNNIKGKTCLIWSGYGSRVP